MKAQEIRKIVRESYGKAIKQRTSCCGSTADSSCCGPIVQEEVNTKIGYSNKDLQSAHEVANQSMGCGNPTAIASLKESEIVLDLGSGGGLDCFLAAQKVGQRGKVIGVDMTPEMIEKARENAEKSKYTNVEFRLGEIKHLPVADNSVDVIISNCVINLAPDKEKVLKEAYRVLKPGGRVAIADLSLLKKLPQSIRESIPAYIGCIGGAILLDDYKKAFASAGFKNIETTMNKIWVQVAPEMRKTAKKATGLSDSNLKLLSKSVVSVYFQARK